MIAKIVTENGVKKLVPLASGAQIGSGLPLGAIIPVYSNVCPSDYLPCNGVAFDENQYPALYNLLGDNHTPDLRECALVGIGESDRASSELATHDVYTLGQFKDDQLQDHTHLSTGANQNFPGSSASGSQGLYTGVQNYTTTTGAITYGNRGAVTRGKRLGVNYCIKATSGLETGQQEYVLQALNEAGSYSTQEVATGKKWIDGKTIYRKTVNFGALPSSGEKFVNHNISNLDCVVDYLGISFKNAKDIWLKLPCVNTSSQYNISLDVRPTQICISVSTDRSSYANTYVTIEYTKTTQ